MQQVKVKKGDVLDDCLKKLKEIVFIEGTLDEVRRLRAHETPKERKIRKARRKAKLAKYLKMQQHGSYVNVDQIEVSRW